MTRPLRNRVEPTRYIMSVEVDPLAYGVRFMPSIGGDRQGEFFVRDADLTALLTNLQAAISTLARRRLTDAICGDCATCQNVRMVNRPRHGRDWLEHCPVCAPKIDRAIARGIMP